MKEGLQLRRHKHDVIVYFASWHLLENNPRFHGEVAGLPWNKVSYVNHAFWCVEPIESPEISSFARKEMHKDVRKRFHIVSMRPEADFGNQEESSIVAGLPKNHFAQYAHFSPKYPQVSILISIGGWTRSGFFSEMAYTQEGRASFIASCLELMDTYSWIGGIDIDWEYPAGSLNGERSSDPSDSDDQGCPIWGTAAEDRANFAALLSELRVAMDNAYGSGLKKLTACASGSTEGTLPCQDWKSAAKSLDYINIMSYDLAGVWDGITGLASSAAQSRACTMYFQQLGIPLSKLCIGSPLYATSFRMKEITTLPIGSAIEPRKPIIETIDQVQLNQWIRDAVSGYRVQSNNRRYSIIELYNENRSGWHLCFDDENGSPYLYNDSSDSPYSKLFLSFENSLSLQMKLDLINQNGLGGIIVWESSLDTDDYQLIRQMHDQLMLE